MEVSDRDERDDDAAALLLALLLLLRSEIVPLIGNPPDPSRITDEFWSTAQARLAESLRLLLFGTFVQSAIEHGADDDDAEELARAQAVRWADRHAQLLAAVLVDSSRQMLAKLAAEWASRVAAGETITAAEIQEKLEVLFGRARAERIASDVVTTAQTAGGEWAVAQFAELSPDDEWQTAADEAVCPICEPLDGQPREVWQAEFPDGPPAHPMCRCSISYAEI